MNIREKEKKQTPLTLKNLCDRWFVDNEYWLIRTEYGKDAYNIYVDTEQWRLLSDTCIRKCSKVINSEIFHSIVTPELIIDTIKKGELKRNNDRRKIKK